MSRRGVSEAGFSALEALVATLFGLVAVAAFSGFVIAQMHGMRSQARQIDLQTSARNIVDLFSAEVRRAGLSTNPQQINPTPSSTPCTGSQSTGIKVATSAQINFRADFNKNGSWEEGEDITYTLDMSNNQVVRKDASKSGSGDVLWSGISLSGSKFRYFDLNGSELVPPSGGLPANGSLRNVLRVKLELTLTGKTGQPKTDLLQTVSESADVTLRNRYFLMSSNCTCGTGCWLN